MHLLDWIVLGLYIAIVVGIGFWANRRQTDTEAYFVGNRNMPWWAAGVSIIATSFSAASILGVPGYAFSDDMWYLQYSLGDVFAAIVVILLFIPFFHRVRGLTTAYQYLEARFDLKTRLLGSSLFILTVLLRAGSLLYGAALLFDAVVPTDLIPGLNGVEEAVVIFGAVAIIYTVMGGISAVIWTDVVQFAVMSFGIIASMAVVVYGTPGDWGQAFAAISSKPAEAMGLGGEYGSLRPGRRGDVVVWDGDPLEIGTAAVRVFIDGVEQPIETRQDQLRKRYFDPKEGALPKAYER